MPIFEYRCLDCGRKYRALVGMTADASVECDHCKSPRGEKLVSRPGKFRTEDDRIDEIADRLEHFGEPESTAEMRELVRELGRAADEDVADDMEEMLEADLEGKLDDGF